MSVLEHPSLLGFEPLFSHLEFLAKQRGGDAYPPYDVLIKDENTYIVRIAVAGFTKDDLRLIAQPHQLLVSVSSIVILPESNTEVFFSKWGIIHLYSDGHTQARYSP